MGILDIKLFIKEGLENIKLALYSDECNQELIDSIVYNTIENIKQDNSEYKNNAIEDFLIEAKRLIMSTDYEIKREYAKV
jgi:hypothetical protein